MLDIELAIGAGGFLFLLFLSAIHYDLLVAGFEKAAKFTMTTIQVVAILLCIAAAHIIIQTLFTGLLVTF